MIHHVSLGTNDLDRARQFYDPIMSRLGLRLIKQSERMAAYGLTEVLFSLELPVDGRPATPGNGTNVAFHAGDRDDVRACYMAGLANGGKDDARLPFAPSTIQTTTRRSCATPTAIRSNSSLSPASRSVPVKG